VRILRVGAAAKAFTVNQQVFDSLVSTAKAAKVARRAKEREAALSRIRSQWPKLTTSKTGLMFEVLRKGSGGNPADGAQVTVHYVGKFLDGKVFDSSIARGSPAQFRIGEVIAGWNEALLDMKKGEKRLLVIPPELAYGERGRGPIPPDAFLVFEVELLDF
jgi:peptidylprolyl isomerase